MCSKFKNIVSTYRNYPHNGYFTRVVEYSIGVHVKIVNSMVRTVHQQIELPLVWYASLLA